MANVIDFFEAGDSVVWNKLVFGEGNFLPLLTTETFGEGPFKVLTARDVEISDSVWKLAGEDFDAAERILKVQSYVQWIEVENCGFHLWQGYWFRLVK